MLKRFYQGSGNIYGAPSPADGRSDFISKLMHRDETAQGMRFRQVVESLGHNRYAYLLDMKTRPKKLKGLIEKELKKNHTPYDKQLLHKCFSYVEDFYGDMSRKDPNTPYLAHVYSIAYWAARFGCDSSTVLTAIFHDCVEMAKSKDRSMEDVREEIRKVAGGEIGNSVWVMTKQPDENYGKYLERVYSSKDVGLMTVKALDMIHNLATLYWEGCPENLRNSVVAKAIEHADIWRKLNGPFFRLMLALIKDNETPETAARIAELSQPSMRQILRDTTRLVSASLREVDLSLLRSLPDAGEAIALYLPSSLQKEVDYLEIEFPSWAGSEDGLRKRLGELLPGADFERRPSKLPKELDCTIIFRSKMPHHGEYKKYVSAFEALANEQFAPYKGVKTLSPQ